MDKRSQLKKDKLARAKSELIMEHPFYATVLWGMDLVMSEDHATAATDAETIWFNPKFLAELTPDETTFVLGHETLHAILEHPLPERHEGRDPELWITSADYVINDLLVKEKVGTMPDGCLYDPEIVKAGNYSTEGVYNYLRDNPEKQTKNEPQQGGDKDQKEGQDKSGGSGFDFQGQKPLDKLVSPKDQATSRATAAKNKILLSQAIANATAQGGLSADMKRFLEINCTPKHDWKNQLRKFFSARAKVEYTYARPNRRNQSDDYLTPSLDGLKLGEIDIPVDCSASVDEKMLGEYAAELNAIREDTYPSRVRVRYFDSKMCGKTVIFEAGEDVVLEPRGGGGTDFAPIFKSIEEEKYEPSVCLIQTDMQCTSYGNIVPSYPVLWCAYGNNINKEYLNVPFGEILKLEGD